MSSKRKKGKGKPPDDDSDHDDRGSDDDDNSADSGGWKKQKESLECKICGEKGHVAQSHDYLCGVVYCDKKKHRRADQHDDKCTNVRTCGERGHTTEFHWKVCSLCQQRGHIAAKCGAVHDNGQAGHRDQVCGFNGHTRSNTPACPFFRPTPKKQQQAEAKAKAPPGSIKKLTIVKMGLRSWVKDGRLLAAFESFQKRSTRILLEASWFMNAHYQWLIEHEHPLPVFSDNMVARTFLNRVFSLVAVLPENERLKKESENQMTTPELERVKQFYDEWYSQQIPQHHRPASRRNLSQALNMLADGYRVGMMNLVTTTIHGRVKRLAKWFLLSGFEGRFGRADYPIKRKLSDMIAGHWISRLTETGQGAVFSLPPKARAKVEGTEGALDVCHAAWSRLLAFLGTYTLNEDIVGASWYLYFPLLASINAEFREHRTAFTADLSTWGHLSVKTRRQRLRSDARSGKLLKPFALLPHHSYRPKYVTYDIEVMEDLRREAHWLQHGVMRRGPDPLGHDEIWESSVRRKLVDTANRHFDYRFATDGVSVSVQCFRMGLPPTLPVQFPTEEQLADYNNIMTFDEGRIDLFRGVGSPIPDWSDDESDMPDEEGEYKIGLSNSEYQTRTGAKYRTRQGNRWKRAAEIDKIERVTPPKTVSTLNEYAKFLAYGYQHLHTLQTFYGSVKQRRQRFDAYIGKRKVQDEVCDELVAQAGGDASKLVAVFGAANFWHASPGHAASGRCGWVRKGLRKRGALVPRDLDEFKTSQRCSCCGGELEDAKVHWQVKRCKNRKCFTTWNRDVNSGRNFRFIWLHCVRNGGERPEQFRRPVNAVADEQVAPPPPEPEPMELD